MNISGMAGFSKREVRVIALFASGATTQDVMAKLCVKKPVVLNYIHFVYRKTGLKTRLSLTKWAKENGLDDPTLVTPGTLYTRNC